MEEGPLVTCIRGEANGRYRLQVGSDLILHVSRLLFIYVIIM